jgi:hypothetical protein
VLRGDATRPAADENWHPLRFEHSTDDYSSFLNNAAGDLTLAVRRRDQLWPRMLLPDIYHGDRITRNQSYGGLIGELPILLALIAFSTSRDTLPNVLPAVFRGGAWKTHQILAPSTESLLVTIACADKLRDAPAWSCGLRVDMSSQLCGRVHGG